MPLNSHDQTRNHHHYDRQHHPIVHDQYSFHSRFNLPSRVPVRVPSELHALTGSDDRQEGGHRANQRGEAGQLLLSQRLALLAAGTALPATLRSSPHCGVGFFSSSHSLLGNLCVYLSAVCLASCAILRQSSLFFRPLAAASYLSSASIASTQDRRGAPSPTRMC